MNAAARFIALGGVIAVLAAAGCDRRTPAPSHEGHASPPASAPVTAAHLEHAGHGGDAGLVDYAPIALDPAQTATLGIKLVAVEERHFERTVRSVGVVALDETRTAHVHSKVRGWIDSIQANFVGKPVRAGEQLCAIYSQDVYAAEIEFLTVLDRVRASAPGGGEFAQAEARAQAQLLEAARRRLSLWDVPKAEIDRLERTREAKRAFPLLAPRSGVIVEKQTLDGMFVDPASELYTISDLSKVWVLADLYEADLPYVHVGDAARLTIEGSAAPVEAKIAFLPPTVDETTRTLKARFELANLDGKVRPGSFVNVALDLGAAHGLAVPEGAVIRTGTRNIVFVEAADSHQLEPRAITIGPLVSGFYRVDAGLSRGDRVALGAQFLLDSESRLRATGGGGGGHAGH